MQKYQRCLRAFVALATGALFFGILTDQASAQLLDGRLPGKWVQAGSGQTVEFNSDGSGNLGFTGQAGAFSGPAQVRPCATGGANICITKERMDCAYFYAFTGANSMNLQFKDGRPSVACTAAQGDYRRQQ